MPTDPRDWTRSPGAGAYARHERERRFLVPAPPPAAAGARLVTDHYVGGTTLRLRSVRVGQETVHKLTQKVRPVADDPSDVAITNTYLTAAEHALLVAALPGRSLTKSRSVHRSSTHAVVVDRFHGPLAGLVLAEVEVQDLDEPLELPAWVGTEVTRDDRFSGGSLAAATADRARELVARCAADRSVG